MINLGDHAEESLRMLRSPAAQTPAQVFAWKFWSLFPNILLGSFWISLEKTKSCRSAWPKKQGVALCWIKNLSLPDKSWNLHRFLLLLPLPSASEPLCQCESDNSSCSKWKSSVGSALWTPCSVLPPFGACAFSQMMYFKLLKYRGVNISYLLEIGFVS